MDIPAKAAIGAAPVCPGSAARGGPTAGRARAAPTHFEVISMTSMMADNRVCAKAVQALLTPTSLQEPPAPVERVVQRIPRAYVFGHYDSRGGSTLIPAKTFHQALCKYAETFGRDENGDDPGQKDFFRTCEGMEGQALEDRYQQWKADSFQELEDEKLFTCEVFVCDEPFPQEPAELDDGYCCERGDGWNYGILQSRYTSPASPPLTSPCKPSKWCDHGDPNKIMVFWKGKGKPKTITVTAVWGGVTEYRIRKEDLGEDACGVVYMP